MSDLNFITQAGKSTPLSLQGMQGQPSIAEELRPVPQAEIDEAVPPPAKGGEPGLGQQLDLYDTDPKPELLGDSTGLPQPTTDPIHLDLPFLKPLSEDYLGHSVDARV
jgi:hypothetical protein